MDALNEASEIVKRKWRNTHNAWKAALVIGLVILAILAVVGLSLWLLGRLAKSLAPGGLKNKDLYIPKIRGQ